MAFDERIVHDEVAARGVLDEEGDVGRVIEEHFQQPHVHAGVRAGRGGAKDCDCAEFHAGARFCIKTR